MNILYVCGDILIFSGFEDIQVKAALSFTSSRIVLYPNEMKDTDSRVPLFFESQERLFINRTAINIIREYYKISENEFSLSFTKYNNLYVCDEQF